MIPRFVPVIAVALLLSPGCGYIGGPLPPLANVPGTVTDLAAVQRGGTIIAHFTLPAFTTEHVAVNGSLTPDLRIGVWPEGASVETWAASATKFSDPTIAAGIATYEIPAAPFVGKEVVAGSRTAGENGKESAWSNYVILPVVPAPDPPHDLAAASTANGVRLSWGSAGEHFRVLRKAGDETQYTALAVDVTRHEFTDSHSTPGTAYSYMVQTVVPLGNNRSAESELREVKITPEAPPLAAPTQLTAVPGPNTIELAWETPPGDVAGYRIYRAAPGGEFAKIADGNGIPAYSDHAVEHGKTYRYQVSALDPAGKEGARSEVREATLQ